MKNIFVLLILFIFIGCKENKTENNGYEISGTIDGDYSGYIYLNYNTKKDSTKVTNNTFMFKGKVEQPVQGYLFLKSKSTPKLLYIENSKIAITSSYQKTLYKDDSINHLKINSIKGSYSAKIQEEYKNFFQQNQTKNNFRALLYEKLNTFIEENKTHPFSGSVLGELALIQPVLSKKELNLLFAKLDTTKQNKGDLQMFREGIERLENYGINSPFFDFKLPNTNGKTIELSAFKGKTTLIDFWASWCGPCRGKHPSLIKLKNKFKDKNFTIVSISSDKNKENWLKAIKEDNLTWTNLLDIDKKVNNELGIIGIPYNYLIDKNGIIIGVNLSIPQIEKQLSKTLIK